jgi:hypothetical protein
MREARIEIKSVAEREDLQRWEDHMLEKAKCWNQYCDGLYSEIEIRAVHVVKEENKNFTYLTTLCEDCIKYTRSYGILVKEKYLMVETQQKKDNLL